MSETKAPKHAADVPHEMRNLINPWQTRREIERAAAYVRTMVAPQSSTVSE